MQVYQVQDLMEHLVDLLLSLASAGRILEWIFDTAFVHAKASGPDDEGHRDELARDLEGVCFTFAVEKKTFAVFQRLQDGALWAAGKGRAWATEEEWSDVRWIWNLQKKAESKNSGAKSGMVLGGGVTGRSASWSCGTFP